MSMKVFRQEIIILPVNRFRLLPNTNQQRNCYIYRFPTLKNATIRTQQKQISNVRLTVQLP
jgi:hypothetical protein